MAFKPGNKLWKMVPFPGSKKKYTADDFWTKFQEYMADNDQFTWAKDDFIKSGPDAGRIVTVDIPNPPSIMMFCVYAGISEQTFNSYRKSEDLSEVSLMIASIIQATQIGGAAANIFNSNIISRWANLVDKKELDLKTEMTDDERADTIKKILESIKKD